MLGKLMPWELLKFKEIHDKAFDMADTQCPPPALATAMFFGMLIGMPFEVPDGNLYPR